MESKRGWASLGVEELYCTPKPGETTQRTQTKPERILPGGVGLKVPTWDRESWGQPQVLGGMEQLFCGGTGQISHLGAEGASRQRFLTQHGCEHRDVMERWGLGRKEKKEVAFGMCGATQRGTARSLCPGDEGEGGSDSGLVYKLLQKPG